jgi:hypothetical protein
MNENPSANIRNLYNNNKYINYLFINNKLK